MAIVKDFLYNNLKHNIEAGKMQYGVALETTSAEVAEVLATTDYDWLFIDAEHGPHNIQTILNVARAIAPYEMTPVVRVGEAAAGTFKQLMDSGIISSCQWWKVAKKLSKSFVGRNIQIKENVEWGQVWCVRLALDVSLITNNALMMNQ